MRGIVAAALLRIASSGAGFGAIAVQMRGAAERVALPTSGTNQVP
jgi:hypothetical protein